MMSLKGKVALISGASRGIGLEIGKQLARKGAHVVVAAKTTEAHPKLPGTIYTAADEISAIGEKHNTGSKGYPLKLDIRDAQAVEEAIAETVGKFGNLDIVVNNASAIALKPTVDASVKSYDLMNGINSRGTWLVSRFALPHLLKSAAASRNPHILTLAPPLNFSSLSTGPEGCWPDQFKTTSSAYTVAKYGMSLATLALSAETKGQVSCNALWPYTMIGTSAMKIVSKNSDAEEKRWRSPEFVSEAAIRLLQEDSKSFTGNFVIDELYLRQHGFTDQDIAKFSMGGEQVKFEELAEDLYISQELRDKIKKSRGGK